MAIVLITGSSGLVGSEAVRFFAQKGFNVVGIDNDMRKYFFGKDASTQWMKKQLLKDVCTYTHQDVDIRDVQKLETIFKEYNKDISLIIHCAAQPSHDWAAQEPQTDFSINANGTLNLLELTRRYCPSAVFIFVSTNKVYGDQPNSLPYVEKETRWEIEKGHIFYDGIDETMSIDQSKHSLFGVSKAAADILVQEYGRYFGMKTACFRGGCLTGPNHSGTMLHGFLSYLMKCCVLKEPYTIFGYQGKQVRDNVHSYDLINAFYHFYQQPRPGEVYNIGGGRFSHCSILEAVKLCEEITGNNLAIRILDKPRSADHIWYISNLGKFKSHFPEWNYQFDLRSILVQIYHRQLERLKS